jgi:hypothetical protein
MLRMIESSIFDNMFATQGEMLVMIYYNFDLFVNLNPSVHFDMITRLCNIISSTRHAEEKRVLSAFLATEFSISLGSEAAKPILDNIQAFLEGTPSPPARDKLYKVANKLLHIVGDKHPLFKSMLVQAKKYSVSKLPQNRLQSLSIFCIFAKTMAEDEKMLYLFRFLADSDLEIRNAARDAIFDDDIVPKALNLLQDIVCETPQKEALLLAGKLPSKELTGIAINARLSEEKLETIPLQFDPFNIDYFKSERRKKYTIHYGLDEVSLMRYTEPLTTSIFTSIEKKMNGKSFNSQGSLSIAKLRELTPATVLRALIPLEPKVAEALVSEYLGSLEACKLI